MMNLNAASFDMAKGLSHLQNCIEYLESCNNEAKNDPGGAGGVKFMREQINTLKNVKNNITRRVYAKDVKDALRSNFNDAPVIDSLMHVVIALPDNLREEVEAFAVAKYDEHVKSK